MDDKADDPPPFESDWRWEEVEAAERRQVWMYRTPYDDKKLPEEHRVYIYFNSSIQQYQVRSNRYGNALFYNDYILSEHDTFEDAAECGEIAYGDVAPCLDEISRAEKIFDEERIKYKEWVQNG